MFRYVIILLIILGISKVYGNEKNINSIIGLKIPKSEEVKEVLIKKCQEMGLNKIIISEALKQGEFTYYYIDFDLGYAYLEFLEEKNNLVLNNVQKFEPFYDNEQVLNNADFRKMKIIEDKYIPIILEIGYLEYYKDNYIEKLVEIINRIIELDHKEIVKILHLTYCLSLDSQLNWAFKNPEELKGKFHISKSMPIELAQYILFIKDLKKPPQVLIKYKEKEFKLPLCFVCDDLPIALFDNNLCKYGHAYFGMLIFQTDKIKIKLKKPEKKGKEYIKKAVDSLYNENEVNINAFYSAVLFNESNKDNNQKSVFNKEIELYFFNRRLILQK